MDVTELIIAQLLYLEFEDPEKPILLYKFNWNQLFTGDAVGFRQRHFYLRYHKLHKTTVHTICIGQAMGTAAVILSSGTKGKSCSPTFHCFTSTIGGARGQATDIQIRAEEVLKNKKSILEIYLVIPVKRLKSYQRFRQDELSQPQEALNYGVIDRILTSQKDLPNKI